MRGADAHADADADADADAATRAPRCCIVGPLLELCEDAPSSRFWAPKSDCGLELEASVGGSTPSHARRERLKGARARDNVTWWCGGGCRMGGARAGRSGGMGGPWACVVGGRGQ